MLLALAIVSMVLAVGFSFHFYVNKSFDVASGQSELQFNVRSASERIESIVRYASYVEIMENVPDTISDEAIYINTDKLMHYKDGSATNLLGFSSSDITYDIKFVKTDKNFLEYTIQAEKDGQTFEISKELQILNINIDDGDEIEGGDIEADKAKVIIITN